MKQFRTGLVVGKFTPLHNGHIALIQFAASQCDNLIVMSYTSIEDKKYSSKMRKEWLQFALAARDIEYAIIDVIDDDIYYPDDTDSDEIHRSFCANRLFYKLNTTVQAVFTSEDYGDGFADYLTEFFQVKIKKFIKVEHVLFDKERIKHYVSGTMLRKMDILVEHERKYMEQNLPTFVYKSMYKRVLFLGAESTGKTTISEKIWVDSKCLLIPEFGRAFYEEVKGDLMYEDMLMIAKEQLLDEHAALEYCYQTNNPHPFILCDSSPLTTLFYCDEIFGVHPYELGDLAHRTRSDYDYIFYCLPDFPMVQDGTRQNEQFRGRMNDFFLTYMKGVEMIMLEGTLDDKIKKVKSVLKI